jgi:cell division protein FtsL
MTKLNLVLLAALLASCLYLVKTTYDTRRLFSDIERARNVQTRLEVDFKRLEAERQAQATHLRVEKVARDRLAMRTATPAVTQYIGADGALVAAAPASAVTTRGSR